ncbi:MAG: hypothetical protein H8E87_07920, partial [FCB group bacterium]|nr:hypothetical protein [FCB group bacterium]
ADIAVGRFSCSNTTQLMTEVNKVVSYESTPYMGETAWYKKGAVVAGSSLSGISSIMVNQAIRWKALQNGYIEVDSLWYTMGGSVPTFTNNEINDGVGFYNYRGWLGMSGYSIGNINNLTNYHKLPFVTTITCGTGDIVGSGSDYTEEFFRVGTPSTPKGAIGAIGAATMSTHTRYNNCVDNGIWGAIFDYDIFQMGDALVSGKLDLYLSFPNNIGNVENYSDWINLIGDPSCQMWTDIPALITVDYPDTIPAGTTSLEITITKTASGNPLPEADVCLYGVNINLFGITDETGFVHFNLPALGEETFQVTCSKHDYKPHLGHVDVIVDEIFVGYDSTAIDDDNTGQSSGNDDSQINPGETIELGLALKNFGSSITAESPIAYLRCGHPYVTILDSTETYSNLAPGGVSALTYGMTFTVSQSAPHNFELPFTLHVESAQGEWDTYLPLIVSAPEMTYQTYTVEDPNGRLDPGDYAPMTVSVMNTGDLTGENITGFLTCGNSMIEINQNNVSYGSIAPGASAAGEGFMIEVSPLIMQGIMAPFDLYLSGGNGFIDTVSFEAVVGTVGDGDPFGPDEYGYYCIDNTDTSYLGYPVYNWIEIDPNYGGIGQLIPLSDFGDEQDDSRQMPMPFTFTYYGQSFDVITICSNGFAAMGELAYFTHFRNWYIPSTLGPPSLLAAFWDDLYLPSNPDGRVYSYYDEPNHKFIVEWSRVKSRGSGYPTETFEIILFDPAHHPTPTGDGKILYQYHTVSDVPANNSWDNDYATVGLESPDDLTGLQYSYWHHLSPGAADLVNGRAILFTTQTPINLSPPAIVHTPIENVTTPQNSYYVFARITSYTVLNDQELKIYWSLLPQGPFTEERLYPNNIGMPEEYFGAIPAVNPGNVVYYYLYAEDIAGAYSYLPAGAPNDLLMFLVGPQVELVFDDVELETGWTLGVPGDDATSGIWVREDPVESIADNGNVVQPENDHTPDPGH